MGLQTINKTLIASATSYSMEGDPSPTSFKTSVEGGFMFGLFMLGVDLNNASRKIFDVSLTQNYYGPLLTKINSTQISLVQCTT